MVCAKRVKLMCVTRPECPKTMKDKVKDKGRRSFIEKNNLQSMFPIFGLQHNEILETEEESYRQEECLPSDIMQTSIGGPSGLCSSALVILSDRSLEAN